MLCRPTLVLKIFCKHRRRLRQRLKFSVSTVGGLGRCLKFSASAVGASDSA